MPIKHTIRSKDGGTVEVTLSRTQAIKAMCTECMGFGEGHPKECTDLKCPLWPFRGKIQLAYHADGEPVEEPTEIPEYEDEGVTDGGTE